ncbi:MAG: c-type cytochrome [Verrucomicrobiales bacterium]
MSSESQSQNIDYRSTLNVARVHNALAREHPDRVAESRPVSLWVALGAIAVTALGFTFFGAHRGSGLDDGMNYNKFGASYQPRVPDPLVPESGGTDQSLYAIGEKVYKGKGCVACHQADGQGQPGLYPPLVGSEWVLGSTERLASLVAYGLMGPLTVKGQQYGAAIMPAHAPPILTPKEFAGVLSFIRQGWGNTGTEVSIEQAATFLSRTKGRTTMYTEGELKTIPEDKMLEGGAPSAAPAPAAAAATTPPAPAPTAPTAAAPQ